MPYDIVAANSRATQVGTALGQAMFNNSLRMQQLQSERALQQLQQQQAAQRLAFELENHNLAIQERADMGKAVAAMQAENVLTQMGPTPSGEPLVPIQEAPTAQSIVKHVLPVVLKYRPQEADNFLANAALYEQRGKMAELAGQPRPRTPEQIAGDTALADQRKAQADLARARIKAVEQGATYAPTDTQKNLRALGEAELAGDKNAIAALRKQLKLDGLTDIEMIKFRSELRALDNDILMDAAVKEQRRTAIYQKYGGAAPAPALAAPAEEETVIVVDPQGKRWRMPRRNLEKALKQGYKEYEG